LASGGGAHDAGRPPASISFGATARRGVPVRPVGPRGSRASRADRRAW
jgi:hypothetical protein